MRSILEQAIVHHLNGDSEKAQELFHQFVVAKARSIHENMRHGDDPLSEDFEEITTEEYFGEDDLSDMEDDEVDADAEADFAADDAGLAADDAGLAADDAGLAADDADIAADDDFGADDLGAEGGDLESEIAELKLMLTDLTDKFDEMMGDEGGDDFDEPVDDLGGDDLTGEEEPVADTDDEFDDDFDEPVDDHVDGGEEEDEFHEAEFDIDEAFDDITESVTSELAKISVSLEDGKGIGSGGKSFEQNRKDALPHNKVGDRVGGKPVMTKGPTYNGYERETPPSSKQLKKGRNTLSRTAVDTLTPAKVDLKTDGKGVGAGGGVKLNANRKSMISGLGPEAGKPKG